ncbi:DUF4118 domain-containing protein [Pseudohalocynthiibacter aestuariivivens]|nr:histidine kinase dimerization/phosphoacceptor domain -containing protein [Pseudohalocynthiibacter aestuariivivens]QIE44344.1 DUF4118 domain-containing protein [Pseudohalocynthiibacter aestuariivivens]
MYRQRLGELDFFEDLPSRWPRFPVQIAFGVACFAVAWLTREFIDLFSNGAGPFSIIYPAIMISTLYGRWQAGLVTFALAFLHAWYFVLPFENSFAFENPQDLARTIVNGSAALVILFFAEVFRAAVRFAAAERDAELHNRELLMIELEHRTKNNFAMVSSLLSMQQRRSGSEDVKQALSSAAARVQSFAAIHETIYTSSRYSDKLSLRPYLEALLAHLQSGLFATRPVRIDLACDPVEIPRDRAVAFGLIVNELVTNAARHAFPAGQAGVITVSYHEQPNAPWVLAICDDGCGYDDASEAAAAGSGLGKTLMTSFATTAGGEIKVDHLEVGTCVRVVETELD